MASHPFAADMRGAITLDWLTLLAGLLVVTASLLFAVGGDVGALARAIGVETSEEFAGGSTLGLSENARPAIIQSEHEPLRLYYPDRPEAGNDESGASVVSAAVDRPLDIGASGAFEPAIAEPDAAEPAPTPVATLNTTEILTITETVSVVTDAPRPDCVLETPADPDDVSPWVGGILQDEVRCREETYGRKAEPKQAAALPEPVLTVPAMPKADLALEGAAVSADVAPGRKACEGDDTARRDAASPWLSDSLAQRLACDDGSQAAD
ncbi:MAG: hypothetical protein AAF968_24235 [Pseudomonadota bacterium]